ncbi:hypothetical protein HBA54_27150 [Pelagibius litoralis]|uniref:Uncharacterized protein n=1 Tax=Pelagibius litoralis TaxID=374515 RepID=A0A967F385_9PROT|nr:hypothetical protein [Pelagibius litoralis]NIA72275.1 hypothetical protein [Pelagibius litoralis]
MNRALPQNLETIAALQIFTVFGYQTNNPMDQVAEPSYFLPCAGRLLPNDIIVACAETDARPAWGFFTVDRIDAEGVHLRDMSQMEAVKAGALSFLRRPQEAGEAVGVGLKVEWGGPVHKWRILDGGGDVIAKEFESKEAAQEALDATAETEAA